MGRKVRCGMLVMCFRVFIEAVRNSAQAALTFTDNDGAPVA